MIAFSDVLLPVLAGVLLYGMAWGLWRCFLSAQAYELPAEQRAKLLLGEFLTDEESRQLNESGHLLVRSPNWAARVYRIPAECRWIDVYDSGRLSMRMCPAQPQGIPAGDAVLMHKFMIEGSEEEYLKTADVRWRRAAGDEDRGWHHVSNSNVGRSTKMLARLEGGEAVKGGIYWSTKDGEFITVPKEGGLLEKGPGRNYIKVPLPIVLIVGPIMGLAFAFFLPLSGVLALASVAKEKLFSGGKVGAAGMVRLQMQPGASYLEPTAHSASTDAAQGAAPSSEDDGKLVELAREIAERRWREK